MWSVVRIFRKLAATGFRAGDRALRVSNNESVDSIMINAAVNSLLDACFASDDPVGTLYSELERLRAARSLEGVGDSPGANRGAANASKHYRAPTGRKRAFVVGTTGHSLLTIGQAAGARFRRWP